jgi:tRNA(fMet)-specific endonuclease VapC
MVVLDTDHFSFLERAESPERQQLLARLEAKDAPEPTVTIVSYEEQLRGWMRILAKARTFVQQVEAYRRLHRQLRHYCAFKVLEFDERAAAECQRLKKLKPKVGTMDLKIAAICLVHDATLLTRNLRDFGQVPALKLEDWTK